MIVVVLLPLQTTQKSCLTVKIHKNTIPFVYNDLLSQEADIF